MPSRNSIKSYIEDGYYHVYNRGVEKRNIFLNKQDCAVFLHYLKLYLSPPAEIDRLIQDGILPLRERRFISLNLSGEIDLLAFSLMPNHVHLLIRQSKKESIIKLTRRLFTSYSMYFNKKYKRVGPLFQGKYKACLVESDLYLLHLSRYIHLNPRQHYLSKDYEDFSSYPYYLGKYSASWIKPHEILGYFTSARKTVPHMDEIFSYEKFIEEYVVSPEEIIADFTLESSRSDLEGVGDDLSRSDLT